MTNPVPPRHGPSLEAIFAQRLIEAGWRPPIGTLTEDGLGMFDSFGMRMSPRWAREPGSHLRSVNEAAAHVMHAFRNAAPVAPDVLIGDRRIMECLNTEAIQRLTGEGEFTLNKTRRWIERGKLPVAGPNRKRGRLLVTRQALVDWFTDIGAHRDPLERLPPLLRRIIVEKRERARETRYRQKIREGQRP
jgi:hypothetical protein